VKNTGEIWYFKIVSGAVAADDIAITGDSVKFFARRINDWRLSSL
jgi:hypothetical protein